MTNRCRHILLILFVVIGVSRPVAVYFGARSELMMALSLSPMIHVFSTHHFFSRIRFSLLHGEGRTELEMGDLFEKGDEETNIYGGKLRYSFVFMDQVLGERLSRALAKFYVCENRIGSSRIQLIEPLKEFEIRFEDRVTGAILKRVVYECR